MASGLGLVGYESSEDEARSDSEESPKVRLESDHLLLSTPEGWIATNEQDNNRNMAIATTPTRNQKTLVCHFNLLQVL